MPVAKKIGLAILSPLFVLLLFATAFDIGFVRTATHPATVKKLIAESGIYNSVVPNVLSQTKSISTAYGNISTSDPAIQSAAKVALPPRFIQQNTEAAIDDIYDWLNGQTAQPAFNIDLSGAKTLFANNIADTLQKRLTALPVCTNAQSLTIVQSGQFDAYNATCVPRGVSAATVAEQVRSNIMGSQDFLAKTDLTAASVKNAGSNQSIFSGQLKNAPLQYQRAKKTPWILSILTILTGIGIVFLSRNWQIGLRHVGISLLIIGLLMLVFAWAFDRTMNKDIIPKIKIDSAIFQQDIRNLATDLSGKLKNNYYFFGGLYATVGASVIGAAEYFRRHSHVVDLSPKKKSAPNNGSAQQPEPAKKT